MTKWAGIEPLDITMDEIKDFMERQGQWEFDRYRQGIIDFYAYRRALLERCDGR